MDISIIIVFWNVKKYLQKCLESIYENQGGLNLEIIIVDNGSSDGSSDMAQKRFPDLRLIQNNDNLGFAKANNIGIKKATGKYFLILNPDTEIMANTLKDMLDFMESRPDCGVAGCKHLNVDGTLQQSVRRFPAFWPQFLILHKLHHLMPNLKTLQHYYAKDFNYEKEQACDQVQGSFFMLSRQCLEKVGLFDENFFIWFEEVDYCKRVYNAGLKVYYNPKARIIHHGSRSFRQISPYKKQKMFNKSLAYYFKKHHAKFERILISCARFNALFLARIYSLLNRNK